MTERVSSSPLDGLEGTRGSVCQCVGDAGGVSAPHSRVHGEDREVWEPPKYICDVRSLGLFFESYVMSSGVPHREVDPLDVITEVGGIAEGVPGSGNAASTAKQNRTV